MLTVQLIFEFLKMKKIYTVIAFIIIIIFASCNSTSPKRSAVVMDGYKINGEITGIDSGWIFLKHTDENDNTIVDSTLIENKRFTFTGKQNTPEQVSLSLREKNASVNFFLDNSEIEITASADSFKNAKVTGSPTQDQFVEYQKLLAPIDNEIASLNKELSELSIPVKGSNTAAQTDSIKSKLATFDSLKNNKIISFIKENPASIVSAKAIISNFLWNPDVDQLTGLYNLLKPQIQKSQYGKTIKEHVDIAQKLAIGKSAPDFSQPDMTGNLFKLSSLRGKFVLIDFWASWCVPCREDNPYLVKAYNKFKNKNFTIVGVSLDQNKRAWINAVKKDHLDWYQVSDLTGLSNTVMQEYGVWVTPTNYLLDKEGTIIGRNLFGEKLEGKLTEILK